MLGIEDYGEIFQLMKTFTNQRSNLTSDEIWMVQHNPVFTQGQAGKDEYILGWQGGFLGHPPREETRTTEAYDAGYEDGQEKNLANIGDWKK